jgi:hypothetical protein
MNESSESVKGVIIFIMDIVQSDIRREAIGGEIEEMKRIQFAPIRVFRILLHHSSWVYFIFTSTLRSSQIDYQRFQILPPFTLFQNLSTNF